MKVVVTGAGGALGAATVAALGRSGHETIALTHADLDITDRAVVLRSIPRSDAIANLAAYTDVDGCERDPLRARTVNADAVAHLAEAASASGATLLHVSTDYVFDGRKGAPYDENDSPAPLSVYGRTKLEGEERAWSAPEHLIARTGFLFGTGRDHLSRSLAALAGGGDAAAIADRTGSPTYVPDLASALVSLLEAGVRGTVHVAGPEPMSPHALLSRAALIGGYAGRIDRQRAADLALPAPRPENSSLTSIRTDVGASLPLPPLDDALGRLLREAGLPVAGRTTA